MLQSESEKKIRQIFDEHFHHLVLSAFHLLNDYDQAEEIVQDVFVKVWQNYEQVMQVPDIKSYLFKAVKNSSMNFLRHVKVRQKFVNHSEILDSNTEKSQEEIIIDKETKRRIHEAVNKLPEKWKKPFVLSKYDKLKYHEIAEDMNISQKTVEKYMSKALHFLRDELKDLLLIFIIAAKCLLDCIL